MKNKSNEDVVDVTGIRKTDRLLQVGGNLSFMKKYCYSSTHFKDPDEVPYTEVYDKIFVSGVDLNDELIGKLSCINAGLIVFFDTASDVRDEIQQTLDTKWYPANTWVSDSNIGTCLMTDACGPSLKAAADGQ